MPSPQDPGSSPNGTDPGDAPSPEWYEEQWSVLADLLNVSDPQKVVARVRTLQETAESVADEDEAETGAAFGEMREQLERLRSQNADLADEPETDAAQPDGPDELHPETEVLLDQLNATSLPEAQDRIRSLNEQLENLYGEKETLAEAGLMSSQEALDEIDRLQKTCDRLRSQQGDAAAPPSEPALLESGEKAETLRRLAQEVVEGLAIVAETVDGNVPSPDAPPDDLPALIRTAHEQVATLREADLPAPESHDSHPEASDIPDEIEDILGVSNAEEARELVSYVHEMNDRLDALAAEQDTLAEHGLDAEQAVAMIDSMEDQLVDLYGTAKASHNGTRSEAPTEEQSPSTASPETRPDDPSIADILGISSPSEARELDQLVRRMSEKLNRLQNETAKLADSDLPPETALEMIETMEAQLADLYHEHDKASSIASQIESLEDVLGIQLPEEEDVSVLARQIQDLLDEGRTALPDAPDVPSVRRLIHQFRSRLDDLQTERDALAERAERLDAIEDVLGISSIDEARELTTLVENLDTQLQTLYAEREKLNEVGLSNVEDAVDMIRSMEGQLRELYQEQEALQDLPDRPEQQDTFQQLESLYKEQEKLKRALGVSDADEVIEMVEDLTAQLDETYADWESDAGADDTEAAAADEENGSPPHSSAEGRIEADSMRHQLEMLYEEKEVLLQRGLENAEEATARIDDLQQQLQTAKQKHADCRDRMERLTAEFGTEDVSEIIDKAKALRDPSLGGGPSLPSGVDSSQAAGDDPFVEAAPSLLPADTSGDLSPADLDELPVGALRLDDEGTIQALNEEGTQFPGLGEIRSRDQIVGTRLFEAVPSTSNALFLGRFKKGVEHGEMDARFPYTFVTPEDQPTTYFIHLYRAGPDPPNWVLFRPARA